MDIPSTCSICNLSSDITYTLQDAIHHPDSFSFDGGLDVDLEMIFRKILKLNSSEQNQQSFVCQQCNYEFCRIYGVLHRFSQTENIFQQLKSITVLKRNVTVMRTVDQKDSSKVIMEEESAENASDLQSNDELKLVDIKQEFNESNNIAEIPLLAIKKEELFIDETVAESTPVTVQPTTFVPTTHQGNILVCPECAESFSSIQALTFHRRKHYSGKFPCDQCNAIFKNYNQIQLHKNSHVDKSFYCSKCNAKFLYRSSLTSHMKKVHFNRMFNCNECDAKFRSEDNLKLHMCVHMGETNEIFACHECPLKFDNKSALMLHSERHKFNCDICHGDFHSQVELENHRQQVHSIKMLVCKGHDCRAKFVTERGLRFHQLFHKCNCDICHGDFHSLVELQNHRQQVHSIKMFVCKWHDCRAKFETIRRLRFHQLIHNRIVYKCNDCDMIIHEEQSLHQHRLTHSEKSDVVAESSRYDEKFASQPALKHHKPTHFFLKYYMCKQCRKTFTTLPALKSHQLLHTEPKFGCDQCDAKYYFQHSLEAHRAVHTMTVEFPCNKYDKNLSDTQSLKGHESESHLNKHYEENAVSWEFSYDCDQPCSKLPDKCALETHEKNILSEKTFDCFEFDANDDSKEENSPTKWDGDGTALSADVTKDEECEVFYIEIASDGE